MFSFDAPVRDVVPRRSHGHRSCSPRTAISHPSTAPASRRPEALLGDGLGRFYSMALEAGLVHGAEVDRNSR